MIKIAPSILSANFAYLGDEIKKVEEAGADMLHIDVMDGHFVPNLTFGPPVISALRKISKLVFDVHLMIKNPDEVLDDYIKAGADIITLHIETTDHLHRLVQKIKNAGIMAGVALNPATPLYTVEHILTDIDMILIMSVNPGFGGQEFIPQSISKIVRLKNMIEKVTNRIEIQVDGGINKNNAKLVRDAGATVLVAGSAIYGAKDVAEAIRQLR